MKLCEQITDPETDGDVETRGEQMAKDVQKDSCYSISSPVQ
jgi:hypothetical protein